MPLKARQHSNSCSILPWQIALLVCQILVKEVFSNRSSGSSVKLVVDQIKELKLMVDQKSLKQFEGKIFIVSDFNTQKLVDVSLIS